MWPLSRPLALSALFARIFRVAACVTRGSFLSLDSGASLSCTTAAPPSPVSGPCGLVPLSDIHVRVPSVCGFSLGAVPRAELLSHSGALLPSRTRSRLPQCLRPEGLRRYRWAYPPVPARPSLPGPAVPGLAHGACPLGPWRSSLAPGHLGEPYVTAVGSDLRGDRLPGTGCRRHARRHRGWFLRNLDGDAGQGCTAGSGAWGRL